jgi:hypothetical protein
MSGTVPADCSEPAVFSHNVLRVRRCGAVAGTTQRRSIKQWDFGATYNAAMDSGSQ